MTGELAGTLRERVTIEQRAPTHDALGAANGGWVHDGAAWAAVTPLAAGPGTEAAALSALPRWQVTLRTRTGITPATRLVWRGRFLAVRTVGEDPRLPGRIILTCEERR